VVQNTIKNVVHSTNESNNDQKNTSSEGYLPQEEGKPSHNVDKRTDESDKPGKKEPSEPDRQEPVEDDTDNPPASPAYSDLTGPEGYI